MKNFLLRSAIGAALALSCVVALPVFAQGPQRARGYEVRDQSTRAIRSAAELGLRKMILGMAADFSVNGKVPANFPFAVSNYSELRRVTLGYGFEVYTVDPNRLLSAAKGASLDNMATGTGVWNFVVLSKGAPVALLEVEQVGGRWEVIGAGGSKLAQDVQASAKANAANGSFRFIRIYQATADLMVVSDAKGAGHYVPLMAARDSLGMKRAVSKASLPAEQDQLTKRAVSNASLPTEQDLLLVLKQAVRSNRSFKSKR